MRKFLEAAVIFVVTFGWWGFIYPELSMAMESCAQEAEAETVGEEAQTSDTGQYREEAAQTSNERAFKEEADPLLKIGKELGSTGISSGNLCIKSRIAEYLYQGKEKDKAEKESDYERQKCTHRGV